MHLESSLSASLTKKLWAQFYDFCVKNNAVCCEVQTHFGSFRLASFGKKLLGAILQFMHPKTKLFAVKFRHILEFSPCEVY